MNKKMVLAALSMVALAATYAVAGSTPAGQGIPGSVHDMTKYGTALGEGDPESQQGRVCAYCHTPHHAITEGNDYLPLWSHTITSKSFTPYNSATIDASIDPQTMMEGPSKLCMSCHDGSVAVDTHYAFAGGKTLTQDDKLFATPAVGQNGNLSNDHPIGFIYDSADGGIAAGNADGTVPVGDAAAGTDPYIKHKAAKYANSNITISERLYFSQSQGAPIMTCATCHDVHNKKNKDEVGATNYLLLATNKGSALCLSCHIK